MICILQGDFGQFLGALSLIPEFLGALSLIPEVILDPLTRHGTRGAIPFCRRTAAAALWTPQEVPQDMAALGCLEICHHSCCIRRFLHDFLVVTKH